MEKIKKRKERILDIKKKIQRKRKNSGRKRTLKGENEKGCSEKKG